MGRWLRRLVWLALLAGAAYAVATVLRRRASGADEPRWPPVVPRDTPQPFTPVATEPAGSAEQPAPGATPDATWVAPVDGGCPDGYPVKANDNSGIFHVPGGRFYDRTVPERCYASADDALADGYRPAKA